MKIVSHRGHRERNNFSVLSALSVAIFFGRMSIRARAVRLTDVGEYYATAGAVGIGLKQV